MPPTADPGVLPTSPTQDGTTPTQTEVDGGRGQGSLLGNANPGTVNPGIEPSPSEPPPAPEPLTWDKLEVPENLAVPEELQTEFLGLVNGGLAPAELAKQSLALHTRLVQQAAEAQVQEWERTQEAWRAEVAQLPEFTGGNQERALSEVAKLVDRYGDAKTREAFDLTGAGNHPAIVQLLYRIAKDLNEQPPVSGAPVVHTSRSREDRLYGGNQGG